MLLAALQWSIAAVRKWAVDVVGIDKKHADKLVAEEINGKSLAAMTEEKFKSCGIPIGPASELFEGVEKLFPERFGAPVAPGPPIPAGILL